MRKRKAKARSRPPAPKSHHLDRRAPAIAMAGAGNNDDLLTGQEVADWFGVSVEWLNQGRMKGYGPSYVKISNRLIRYRRGTCREYLQQRSYQSTAEYTEAAR
jgi:hypothetical protein